MPEECVVSVREIKEFLSENKLVVDFSGSESVSVNECSSLNSLSDGKMTWIKKWSKETYDLIENRSGNIIVCRPLPSKFSQYPQSESCYIICDDPKMCFFEIVDHFFKEKACGSVISEFAKIYTNNIGVGCSIGDFTVISSQAVIGDHVTIGSNVSIIGKVNIGNYTVIQSGAVIGESGGGYYKTSDGHFKKVPHLGGVVIGEHVEIGANTCIDRGTLDDTVIGDYCKIDNLCHIAHNVQIGNDVMIVAGVILGGSCVIEDGSYIALNATVKNQLRVGKDAFVGMSSCAARNVPDNSSVFGVPAEEFFRTYKV